MGMVGWVRLLPPLLCHMAPPGTTGQVGDPTAHTMKAL